MNGSASGTVSSTFRNASSEVLLAAGRWEEKIRVGWSWRTPSRTSLNRALTPAPAVNYSSRGEWSGPAAFGGNLSLP